MLKYRTFMRGMQRKLAAMKGGLRRGVGRGWNMYRSHIRFCTSIDVSKPRLKFFGLFNHHDFSPVIYFIQERQLEVVYHDRFGASEGEAEPVSFRECQIWKRVSGDRLAITMHHRSAVSIRHPCLPSTTSVNVHQYSTTPLQVRLSHF